jgi:hypothetical protein
MDVEKLNIKTRLEGRLIRGSRRDRYIVDGLYPEPSHQ